MRRRFRRNEGGWQKWMVAFLLATPPPFNLAWYIVLQRQYGRPPPMLELRDLQFALTGMSASDKMQLASMVEKTQMLPNVSFGEYVRGEYWILDGQTLGADGDIGPAGHEEIAIDHLMDKDVLVREVLPLMRQDNAIRFLSRVQHDEETGAGSVYLNLDGLWGFRFPESVGIAACGGNPDCWRMIKRGEAREAFEKYFGAVLVVNSSFQVWELTDKTLREIQNHIDELAAEGEIDATDRSEAFISEVSTDQGCDLSMVELLNARSASALKHSRSPHVIWRRRR